LISLANSEKRKLQYRFQTNGTPHPVYLIRDFAFKTDCAELNSAPD
jgi:hypothetical protein